MHLRRQTEEDKFLVPPKIATGVLQNEREEL